MEDLSVENIVGFLQEYCQKNYISLPIYQDVGTSGQDHCREFTVSCKFSEYIVNGSSTTKKNAKKEAAKNMFTLLQEKEYFSKTKQSPVKAASPVLKLEVVDGVAEQHVQKQPSTNLICGNPIGLLIEYAMKRHSSPPTYNDMTGISNLFTMSCTFDGLTTYGSGPQKKLAKAAAASNMIKTIKEKGENINGGGSTITSPNLNGDSAKVVDKEAIAIKEEVKEPVSSQEVKEPVSTQAIEQLAVDGSLSPTQSFIED